MTFAPVSPFQREGADFNRPAAERVYKQLMGMDADSALVYGRMLVGAAVQNDLIVHGDQIAEVITKMLGERTDLLRTQLVRSSVSKARAGQDNSAELSALVELSKAGFFGALFSPFARSQRAKEQKHNTATGRFEVMHERVQVPQGAEQMPGRYAEKLGIPLLPDVTAKDMESSEKAAYQHAYMQVERLLRPYADLPDDTGIVTFHYDDAQPTWWKMKRGAKIPVIGTKTEGEGDNAKDVRTGERGLDPTKKLEAVTLDVFPQVNAQGGIFAALNALGMPKLGAIASNSAEKGALNPGRLDTFNQSWNRMNEKDQFTPSTRVFRRLDAGSHLLEDSLGNAAPPQVKMALSVSRHVGNLGPRATTILAPTLDRAAYRYRGTERPVDQALLTAQKDLSGEVERRASIQGKAKSESAAQREQAKAILENAKRRHDNRIKNARGAWDRAAAEHNAKAMSRKDFDRVSRQSRAELDQAQRDWSAAQKQYPLDLATADAREKAGTVSRSATDLMTARRGIQTKTGDWIPGQVLSYFKARVPSPELNELQLASGVVPPSEGVILDGNGKILLQTVGYGDDHYMPFTLRNLSKLRGGYYIRTRTFGGPTSEDIYTSLISGARGLTVVSNSGVFTLDFDHDFKGGRRFNDKAARMVARYGHLLDAVGRGQVPGAEISGSRLRELHHKASELSNGDQAGTARAFAALREQERDDPRLSRPETQAVAVDYLNQELERQNKISALGPARAGLAVGNRLGPNGLTLDAMAQVVAAEEITQEYPGASAHGKQQMISTLGNSLAAKQPDELAYYIARHYGIESGLGQALTRAEDERRKQMKTLTLDGHGYDVAMQALKEQFPYYIADTKYRPFETGTDRIDTGYVKPKFNRPEAAQAGYFDATIGGGGKYSADSIRNQNAPIMRGELHRAGAERRQPQDQSTPAPAAAAAAATAGAATAAGAAATPVADPRKAADRAMLDHLLSLQNFGPHAFADGSEAATQYRGTPIRNVNDAGAAGQDLKKIYGYSEAAVRADQQRDPEAFRATMKRVVAWMTEHRASDELDPNVVEQFDKGVAAPVVRGVGNPVVDLRDSPDRDYAFGETHARRSASVTPAEVQEAYVRNPVIEKLVNAGELPAHPGDDGYLAASKELRTNVLAEEQAALAWANDEHQIGDPPAVSVEAAQRRAYGLLLANQYHRRYKEAVSNHAQVQERAAEQAPVETVVRNEVYFADPRTNQLHQIEAAPEPAGGVTFLNDLLGRMQPQPQPKSEP